MELLGGYVLKAVADTGIASRTLQYLLGANNDAASSRNSWWGGQQQSSANFNPLQLLAMQAIGNQSANAMSSSITSFLTYQVLSYGAKTLYSYYGDDLAQGVTDAIDLEVARFKNQQQQQQERRKNTAKARQNERNTDNGHGWFQWEQAGANHNRARSAIAAMPSNNLAIYILIFGMILPYLHAVGAYEIKRNLKSRHLRRTYNAGRRIAFAPPPHLSIARTPSSRLINDAHDSASGAAPPLRLFDASKLDAQRGWDQAAYQDAMMHTMAARDTVDNGEEDEDPAHDEGYIFGLIENMYTANAFYDPQADGSYLQIMRFPHPVRTLINIMLGFIMQTETLLLGRKLSSSAGSSIQSVAQAISALAYWELFAHAIRVHGWAPVYTATRYVLHVLMAGL